MANKLNILQVNTLDVGGGAAKIAWNLFQTYNQNKHASHLAVGHKSSNNPLVYEIPKYKNSWYKFWVACSKKTKPFIGKIKGAGRAHDLLLSIAQPQSVLSYIRSTENFNFSGTKRLLELCPIKPDILHAHNLHGDYFDLRLLPQFSTKIPTILTLHDAWMLGGHCAHSFQCTKWKTGCNDCPNLSIPLTLRQDSTKYNWMRKKEIYQKSKLYIATPCQWLMNKVNQSILSHGIIEKKVIHNGIDLSVFRPTESKNKIREKFHLAQDSFVLLFVGHLTKSNPWKDYKTLEKALIELSKRQAKQKIIVLCLGQAAEPKKINNIEIKFIPYTNDDTIVAQYYQLSDVYVHPAKAETFPNSILEALACGLPVIATNVGGIPEQITQDTGILYKQQNAADLSQKIISLSQNKSIRKQMGVSARKDAEKRFDLEKQTKQYLNWYQQILNQR
ncbi:glycosyltransferase [Candidatus Dependentiae bacterium]|nr:glycosyltransferase [Candidatus Dependentiae bacterium]